MRACFVVKPAGLWKKDKRSVPGLNFSRTTPRERWPSFQVFPRSLPDALVFDLFANIFNKRTNAASSKSQKVYGIPMVYQTFLGNFVKPFHYPTACKSTFGIMLIATHEIISKEGKVQSVWTKISQWRWTVSSCPISVFTGMSAERLS